LGALFLQVAIWMSFSSMASSCPLILTMPKTKTFRRSGTSLLHFWRRYGLHVQNSKFLKQLSQYSLIPSFFFLLLIVIWLSTSFVPHYLLSCFHFLTQGQLPKILQWDPLTMWSSMDIVDISKSLPVPNLSIPTTSVPNQNILH
jgi:hypothetical protein